MAFQAAVTYDKDLFLSGVAVGRQLKGWGAVGSGGAAGYRNLDLRCWEKTRFSSPITFDGERNTVAFQAVSGYYERLYCPAMVKPHTNYRFSVEFSGTFEEGNSPGKTTYSPSPPRRCRTPTSKTRRASCWGRRGS